MEDVVVQARCRAVREALSAMVDGEDATLTTQNVRTHLAGCPDCARWWQRARRMDRLLGVGVIPGGPDLADTVLARVRLPHRGRWRAHLRVAMVVVALFQVTTGLADMFDVTGMTHVHTAHEEAAFGVAFGVAMLMVAWNSRRASSEIPVLATFVAVLAVTSVTDLVDGQVTWARLATHVPVVVGLILAVALARNPPAGDAIPGPATDLPDPAVLVALPERRGKSVNS